LTNRPIHPAFWLVVAATLLAAFSRWFGLNHLPPQAWVDEIWFALRAREIFQTGDFPLFYKTFWGGVNPLLAWLTAIAQLAPFTAALIASRVVSTTFAVLSVPLMYACSKEFLNSPSPGGRGGRGVRATAALILSNFFFTVALSRLGTEPAVALAAALFCVWQQKRAEGALREARSASLAMYPSPRAEGALREARSASLAMYSSPRAEGALREARSASLAMYPSPRAERSGAWLSFALAGLGAGLAQYLSPHARFILPLLALFGLHALWLAAPGQRRRLILGYLLLAGVAALAAAPLIAFFMQEPQWLWGRAQAITTGVGRGLPFYLDNARAIALSFSLIGDPNPRDNLALRPLLDPLQTLGFLVGLIWAVLDLRRSAQARELLLWLLVMASPSLLTDDAPSFSRMIGIAPPVAALIAVGWGRLWEFVRPRLPARLGWPVVCAWVALSLGLNSYDYFVRYAQHPALPAAFTVTAVNVARELSARAETEPVFVERVSEAEADIYAFDFLFPGTRVERLDFRQCLPLADDRAARTTYLVWSERDAVTAPDLLRLYPNASVRVIRGEPEALYTELTQIELPPGARLPRPPFTANARFAPGLSLLGHEQSALSVRPGESVFFTFYWKSEAPLAEDVTPFLHVGSGLADSAFVIGRDGQPCQGFYPTSRWRVGDVVPDRFAVIIPADAAPGTYPLVVGWYRYPSLNRLTLESADRSLGDNRAVIGMLTILP
jgi:hypothetical protein